MFVVFEGLDGAGKSSLMAELELRLGSRPRVRTREPGGTPLAESIRDLFLRTEGELPEARTELLLIAAARAQHVTRVVAPALAEGQWVLCDRFTPSTRAFQGAARGLPMDAVDWLSHFATGGLVPDQVVLIDVPVEVAQQRRHGRTGGRAGEDRMEREAQDFHNRVRQGYLDQAAADPQRWLVLKVGPTASELADQVSADWRRRGWL